MNKILDHYILNKLLGCNQNYMESTSNSTCAIMNNCTTTVDTRSPPLFKFAAYGHGCYSRLFKADRGLLKARLLIGNAAPMGNLNAAGYAKASWDAISIMGQMSEDGMHNAKVNN